MTNGLGRVDWKFVVFALVAMGLSGCYGDKNIAVVQIDPSEFEIETRHKWPLVIRHGWLVCSPEGVLFETVAGGQYELSYDVPSFRPSFRELMLPRTPENPDVIPASNELMLYGLQKCLPKVREMQWGG